MCNEQNNRAKLCVLVINYTCVIWHFQILLKSLKSIISYQHSKRVLGPVRTQLTTWECWLHETHQCTNQPAPIIPIHLWEKLALWVCPQPWCGWGCGSGAGWGVSVPKKGLKTPSQWLLAWKKLPWTPYMDEDFSSQPQQMWSFVYVVQVWLLPPALSSHSSSLNFSFHPKLQTSNRPLHYPNGEGTRAVFQAPYKSIKMLKRSRDKCQEHPLHPMLSPWCIKSPNYFSVKVSVSCKVLYT